MQSVEERTKSKPERKSLLLAGHYDAHVTGPKSDQIDVFGKLKSTYYFYFNKFGIQRRVIFYTIIKFLNKKSTPIRYFK